VSYNRTHCLSSGIFSNLKTVWNSTLGKTTTAAKWLGVLLYIWKILGSNLGPKIGYPDGFS
jgi:hypothetical protein